MNTISKKFDAIELGAWAFWSLMIIHHIFTVGEFDTWLAFAAYYITPSIVIWIFMTYYMSKLSEDDMMELADRQTERGLKWIERIERIEPYIYKLNALIQRIKR